MNEILTILISFLCMIVIGVGITLVGAYSSVRLAGIRDNQQAELTGRDYSG